MLSKKKSKPASRTVARATRRDYVARTRQRILQHSQFMQVLTHLVDHQIHPAAELLAHPDLDHQAFLEFITRGKVRNFVSGVLGLDRVQNIFPPKFAKILLAHWKLENERKSELWAWQDQLLSLCEDASIPVRVLKGIVFGDMLYEDIRYRHQSDLDLLVQKPDLERSLRLFQDQGLSLPKNRQNISTNQLRCEHAITLAQGQIKVDLHWCLRTAPAYSIDNDLVWQNARTVCLNDQNVQTISNEWALALLLISFSHDLGRGGGKLKHVVDICLFVRACSVEINWEHFWKARQTDGTINSCVNALAFVSALLGPEAIPAPARDAMIPHLDLTRINGQGHSLFLLDQPRRSIHNAMWFCGVYPMRLGPDTKYALDRILTRPSRIPLLLSRILKRSAQATKYGFEKLFTQESLYPTIDLPSSNEPEASKLHAA